MMTDDAFIAKCIALADAHDRRAEAKGIRPWKAPEAKGIRPRKAPDFPVMKTHLTEKERGKYSLASAIRSASKNVFRSSSIYPDGLEREISQSLAAAYPETNAKGFLVPFECLKTVNANTLTAGGALGISAVHEPMDVLRNRSVVANAGAMLFEDVKGTLTFPRQKTGAVGQWLSEIGQIQAFDAEWDALRLEAHRLGALTRFTRELLVQSGGAVERWARREVLGAVASAIDKGALSGNGNVEPLGISRSELVPTHTFGGPPNNADAVEMERIVANNNAPDENISFIASPDVRATWRNTLRTEGDSRPLWGDDGRIIGRTAYATKNAPDNRLICGAFDHYAIAVFGLLDVLVNPYNEDAQGVIRVTINAWADCGEFYPGSFCVSTDAANQT